FNPASAPHTPQPLEPEEHQTMLASSPHLAPFFDITPRTVSRWIRRYQESHEDIRKPGPFLSSTWSSPPPLQSSS
ncbi:helix-turn-helix domain-containing protein, partial [Ktedonobacter robiniae]|uniref:helix-turn-helix domain-containing protein n=1 Tax=Ktedonobacter robiniae TaxID=2778365 RepID=UPI001F30CA22